MTELKTYFNEEIGVFRKSWRINEIRGTSGSSVWQRNYHEHIIRNEKSLEKIRQYVIHNPQTWEQHSLFSH